MDIVQTLSQLVAIPSVNPMGRPGQRPEYGESRLTDYLESSFRRCGIACRRDRVEPGRENLIARVEGTVSPERGGKLALFAAHQDTVPVEGMTIDPFVPNLRSDRLYGRGACDVKGGLTAMLAAVVRLAQERPPGMPTVIMACTVNEEYGFTGASALTRQWTDASGGIIPRRPDYAVVAEPTSLQVVVAHKGVLRWRVHTRGRAAHGSQPEAGDNAIYRMARVVQALERYHGQVLPEQGSHARCGGATLNVGTIHGGLSVNTVPDHCTIEVDRRLMPEEVPEEAYRRLVDYLANEMPPDAHIVHDPPFMLGYPLPDGENRAVAERLTAIARGVVGACRQVGVPYATDAAFFAAAGVPSVVFGPGSLEQAHTADEWVSVAQVEQAAEVLYRFGRAGIDG